MPPNVSSKAPFKERKSTKGHCMHGKKTGVITSKERSGMFKDTLPRGTIIECDPSRRVTDILKEFSRKAVDVALIDDEGLSDPEANELEILDWTVLPQTHPVHIVFASSPKRKQKDTYLKKLASAQGLDVIYPDGTYLPMESVLKAIGANAEACSESDMLEPSSHPLPIGASDKTIDSTDEPEPDWSDAVPESPKPAKKGARRCKTISTASLFGHPGATTLAMSVAFWLARDTRKKVVCTFSDNSLYNLLKAGFRDDGKADSFTYKGVTFCPFSEADAHSADVAFAVFDCGHLFTTHADTPASSAHRRFYTSDIKLMCIEGQPWDLPKLKEAIRDMSPGEVASWTWCARGAAEDFITQVRSHLAGMGADTERWFRTSENADFFGRKATDRFDKINYNAVIGRKGFDDAKEGAAYGAE